MSKRKNKSVKRAKRKKIGIWRKLFYWSLVACLWAGIFVSGSMAYVILALPKQSALTLPKRAPSLTILAADGSILTRRGAFAGDDIELDELPIYVTQAVVATEDRRFYHHFGIDPIALARAFYANFKAGRITQGGSTLTQQLAKNLFLKSERTFKRKFQEALLALWLEYKYTKKEILQLYLNRVYFGAGAYGIEAASRRYYRKSARQLGLAEAAIMAGLLKAPSRYAPNRHRKKARARAFIVLNNMVRSGYITHDQGQHAVDNPAIARSKAAFPHIFYVVDWINELLPGFIGKRKTDLVIETTIDPRLQRLASLAVMRNLDRLGKARKVDQAAMIVFDNNGAVRALMGGRSYAQSQFNRAIKAKRQPGSTFKLFVYLAALERGYRPDSMLRDEPISIKGWRPRNYSGRYMGNVTLKDSLAHSINTIAVKLAVELGGKRIVKTARRLGISSPLHENPSIALGTAEISLKEITSAYVPLANGGYGIVPHIINKVRTPSGKTIYKRAGSGLGRIIRREHIGAMNMMLRESLLSGTGRAAYLRKHAAAGKTGTSQDFRDAWFIGYTAHLTAGVWVGNDNGKPTKKITGGGLPAYIWRDFMAPAHARLPKRPLPEIGNIKPAPKTSRLSRFLKLLGL